MFQLVVFVALIPALLGISCESPRFSSSGFSTLDGFFHYSTTYIVEFNLQCANDVKNMPVYAVINGKSYSAAVCEETGKYQVSWRLEHSESSKQTFNIVVYDEDKFANYQKAERNGEDTSSVTPLFQLSHYHAGISKKWPVSAETIYVITGVVIAYYAISLKSQLKH